MAAMLHKILLLCSSPCGWLQRPSQCNDCITTELCAHQNSLSWQRTENGPGEGKFLKLLSSIRSDERLSTGGGGADGMWHTANNRNVTQSVSPVVTAVPTGLTFRGQRLLLSHRFYQWLHGKEILVLCLAVVSCLRYFGWICQLQRWIFVEMSRDETDVAWHSGTHMVDPVHSHPPISLRHWLQYCYSSAWRPDVVDSRLQNCCSGVSCPWELSAPYNQPRRWCCRYRRCRWRNAQKSGWTDVAALRSLWRDVLRTAGQIPLAAARFDIDLRADIHITDNVRRTAGILISYKEWLIEYFTSRFYRLRQPFIWEKLWCVCFYIK